MVWVRGGDTSATYPPIMRSAGLSGADARTVNEISGFLFRLSCMSAQHTTDYVVDMGTVAVVGGERTEVLVRQCKKLKLLSEVKVDGMRALKIVDDPDFLHLRLKAELEWEAQQRQDGKNEALTVPVRLRDGDLCRYCGVAVMWLGRPSARSATFDHIYPGQAATVSTMVVACRSCNSGLRDVFGREHEQLKPVPTSPFYSDFTADWLTSRGQPVAATQRPDHQSDHAPRATRKASTTARRQRPGSQPDTAPTLRPGSQPDNAHQRPGSQPDNAHQRPGSQPDNAPADSDPAQAGQRAGTDQHRADKSTSKSISGDLPRSLEGGSDGSGRDGAGATLISSTGPPTDPAATGRPKRSPRGRTRNAPGDR